MSTKDWLEKDYYKVLGVSKDAKPDEIKRAFRKIARDNHPDQHPGDAKAEARFKEASEANSVLSDPAKRKEYDEQRSLFAGGGFFPRGGAGGPGGFGGFTPGATNINVEDLLRGATGGSADIGDLFGGLFGAGAPGARRTTRSSTRRGQDVTAEATIDFRASIAGTTVSLKTVSDAPCAVCHGTGAKSGSVPHVCATCQGSGMATAAGGFGHQETCPTCHGRGLVVDDPCAVCAGTGREMSSKAMQVRIPAGVTDGQKIRIRGKGGAGESGGPAGDLFVVVHVTPDPVFTREGNNIAVSVPVLFTEAALGAQIEAPTLDGSTVKLRLAPGTPGGRTLRVRGKGVKRPDGTTGDLLVNLDVQVPATLSPEAKAALEAYRDAAGETDPRAGLLGK